MEIGWGEGDWWVEGGGGQGIEKRVGNGGGGAASIKEKEECLRCLLPIKQGHATDSKCSSTAITSRRPSTLDHSTPNAPGQVEDHFEARILDTRHQLHLASRVDVTRDFLPIFGRHSYSNFNCGSSFLPCFICISSFH